MQITVQNYTEQLDVWAIISAESRRRADCHFEAAKKNFRAYEDTENYSQNERNQAYAAHKRHTQWGRDAVNVGLKAKGYPTLDELEAIWLQRQHHLTAVWYHHIVSDCPERLAFNQAAYDAAVEAGFTLDDVRKYYHCAVA